MPRYQFAIGGTGIVREAGFVHSESFSEAITAISRRVQAHTGDTLEIGVAGFPPARYECLWAENGNAQSWKPEGLLAA
jgi:hypothetical protein